MPAAVLTCAEVTPSNPYGLPAGLPKWMYKVRVTIEVIGPKKQDEYLALNTGNYRPLREFRWNPLREMMEAGEWQDLNGDTISFSIPKPGRPKRLLNGANRLQAARAAGHTLVCIVVYDLPEEQDLNMDTGNGRKFLDVLTKEEKDNPKELAATLGLLYTYRQDPAAIVRNRRYPNARLLKLLAYAPDIERAVAFAVSRKKDIPMASSYLALARYHTTHAEDDLDPDDRNLAGLGKDVDNFWSRLSIGDDLTPADPIYRLRQALERSARKNAKSTGHKKTPFQLYVLTIKAWNLFRDNEIIPEGSPFSYRQGERFPIPR